MTNLIAIFFRYALKNIKGNKFKLKIMLILVKIRLLVEEEYYKKKKLSL
jgi:hypothetical protein